MKYFLKNLIKKVDCFDDKRYILSDGIHTLPYGNEKIKIIENLDEINEYYQTKLSDLDIYNMNEFLDNVF